MQPSMFNFAQVMPEIFLLSAACIILLADLFVSERRRHVTFSLTLLSLVATVFVVLAAEDGRVHHALSNMVVVDTLGNLLKVTVCLAVAVVLIYSQDYLRQRDLYKGEFYVLALFSTLGMMIMIGANHLLSLYLGLELMTLSLYGMVALNRDSVQSSEAAMKYFVLGALASGMLLYGLSMLYGVTGTLEIPAMADAIAAGVEAKLVLALGLVFVVAGLGFKLGAVPFHMWIPDVYQGATTPVTLFIGAAPKLAAFAFIARLLIQGLEQLVADWQQMLIIMALLSVAIGNITAIAQTNLKRMLAFSTIAQMGFVLFGFAAGSADGYSGALFYMVTYVLMTLGSFGMILLLAREGFECENIADLKGLNRRQPWYAAMMMLVIFSLAGVPPTVGFYSKFSVLNPLLEAGFAWVAVAAVLMSVIGAFYYLRIVKVMYFDDPERDLVVAAPAGVRSIMSVNGLSMLALGLLPQPLMTLCAYAIRQSL